MPTQDLGKVNLGIGIANSVWVASIASIIIFANGSLWLLVLPILFNWSFVKN